MRKNDPIGREKLMMKIRDAEFNCNKGIFTIVFKSCNKKLAIIRLEILSIPALSYY